MDSVLQGIPHCICYLDDILVTGTTDEDHLSNLEEVLNRLQQYGIHLREEKCQLLKERVDYLGHCIDSQGVHTSKEKVRAILEAPRPRNLSELRSFLGLLNYYAKFIANLASILHPLYQLLQANHPWRWSKECERSFHKAKESLMKSPVLTHYDPSLQIVMAADASAYGIGAVISHRFPDGSEKPIAFASRTLTKSEQNYAQVEKEALSLVFGIHRFHQYLYGRHFILITDHKPLTTILGPKQGVPPLAAARMQRWALLLSAYSYDIQFRPTKEHANADGLSRLPLDGNSTEGNTSHPTVFNLKQLSALPVQAHEVAAATRADSLLSKLLTYLRTGWPKLVPDALTPFWRRKDALTVEGDCILWGCRVVIPDKLQAKVLDELHQGHPGVVRMKVLARNHMWWPGLDQAIEKQAKGCCACQATKHLPAKAPLHSWAWPTNPWERVHVDFAGPIFGKMLLLAVDSHSKWPEVQIMSTTTTDKTIGALRDIFARFGIPHHLVSDNGPQFTSEEFQKFLASNGIKHIRCSPYHPASNGAVERLVQTVKRALRASREAGLSLEQSLAAFLLQYRTTPHATTGAAPCHLMFGRDLRTRLHLLSPDVGAHVREQQAKQKAYFDCHSRRREFCIGQSVWTRNFRHGPPWLQGVVSDILGPVTYLIQMEDGVFWRRHIDHLREASEKPPEENRSPGDFPINLPSASTQNPSVISANSSQSEQAPTHIGQSLESTSCDHEQSTNRYPSRVRKPPD